jgi:MoxR-like ATPase
MPVAGDVAAALAGTAVRDVRQGLANLSGGRWGQVQFGWIPRAVEYGLGDDLRAAFESLVGDAPLVERIDRFREDLYAVQTRLRELGGFERNWRLINVSLAFVAALLGAYDPSRYTFYAYGSIRRAFDDFGMEWPQGTVTAGEKYQVVRDFVAAVADALRAAGVPVQDLIDAQSFLYMRLERGRTQTPPEPAREGPAAPEGVEIPLDAEAISRDLARETYWPLDRARRLVDLALARRSRQLLFQGPPGTGKTYVAQVLARLLTSEQEDRWVVVQFHPSYAYEDFVEGIRPRLTEDQTTLRYEVREGVFLDLVERAREATEALFVLVIDEINRANLPRVLGELLYALEYRGREYPFRLPYSGREAYVPENLLVIGTMNTADRSIALVDAAVRRRFRHVELSPEPEILRRWLKDRGRDEVADLAATRLEALNAHLLKLLDRDRLIGHSYLMREDLTEDGFEVVWAEDIEPVLREHLYNRPEEVEELKGVFLGRG